jgi:pimeloyl-ACP methyl ester carboxylesterase
MDRISIRLDSGLTLSALEGGSHFMFLENLSRFNARVSSFLESTTAQP